MNHISGKLARFTVAALIALAPVAANIAPAGAQPAGTLGVCSEPNVQASTVYAAPADRPGILDQMHLTGKTIIQIDLDPNGAILNATVAKSSGFRALDLAALDAAKSSRFQPAVQNCVSTSGTYLFEVDFE